MNDNIPNSNFQTRPIKDGFGKSYKQSFNNFTYKAKKAIYKIALVTLLVNIFIIYSQGGNIFFALTHPSFMKAAREIPSESIDSATEYILSFKREVKQEIEKKEGDFFPAPSPIKEEKSSNPVSLLPVAKAATDNISTAKAVNKIDGNKIVTAYSPTVRQTDSTPCIAASNLNICDIETKKTNSMRLCASNDYSFGQVLEVAYLKGGKCVVVDTMKDKGKVDIFFMKESDAINFGKQNLKVTPVEKISLAKVNELFGIKAK